MRKKHRKLAKVMLAEDFRTKRKYLREHERYVPTEAEFWHWFGILNRAIFNNSIPNPEEVKFYRLRGDWARCDGYISDVKRHYEYKFNFFHYFKSLQHFIEIIAHEMVHAYEWSVKGGLMSHGPNFYAWREPLSRYNITLTE